MVRVMVFSTKIIIYKKSVFFGETERDKDIFIEFEGVYSNAFVYVNGAYAGKCPYGYADKMHFAPEGVHLATVGADEEMAVIRVQADIEYHGCGVREVQYCVELIDTDGNMAASASMPITIIDQSRKTYQQSLYVENPRLWDEMNPALYRYHAYLREDGLVLDEEEGTFGIRTMQLDPKYGLRINGKAIKLRRG